MNIYSAVQYTIIGCAFFTVLLAFLSPNQITRQKLMILFVILGVIYLGILVISFNTNDFSSVIGIDLATCIVLPQVIARIINLKRLKAPLFRLRIDKLSLFTGLIGILFILFFTWLFLHPSFTRASDGEPIYDLEYFRSRASFLFAAISLIILFLMVGIQPTAFYADGIIFNGLLLSWENFQAYTWKSNDVLLLRSKGLWFSNQLELKISIDDKNQVENILAQKILQEG